MVVGEPSLMGGEFGDEDERLITRLENNQYDPSSSGPSNGMEDNDDFGGMSGPPVSTSQGPGGPSGNQPNPSGGPPPWSGQPPTSTSGSGPPSTDSRTGNSTGSNGPPGPEDKKHSPISQ